MAGVPHEAGPCGTLRSLSGCVSSGRNGVQTKPALWRTQDFYRLLTISTMDNHDKIWQTAAVAPNIAVTRGCWGGTLVTNSQDLGGWLLGPVVPSLDWACRRWATPFGTGMQPGAPGVFVPFRPKPNPQVFEQQNIQNIEKSQAQVFSSCSSHDSNQILRHQRICSSRKRLSNFGLVRFLGTGVPPRYPTKQPDLNIVEPELPKSYHLRLGA